MISSMGSDKKQDPVMDFRFELETQHYQFKHTRL